MFADLGWGEFFRFPGGTEVFLKYARTGYANAAGAYRARRVMPVEPVAQAEVPAEEAAAIKCRVPPFRR